MTAKNRKRPLTPWELPQLLTPLHEYKLRQQRTGKDRPHFNAILGFIYRNRFVVTQQVQRRFSSILKSDRTARRHLAEMEELGYLGVAPTRSTSPLWPKVYFVTQRGSRRLRRALATRGKRADIIRIDRSRSNGYAADHVLHELLTTEFLLAVWQTTSAASTLELCQIERRSLACNAAFEVQLGYRSTRLEPDAMFVHRERGRGLMCSFVELDTGSMRLQQMTAKFARYEAWANSEVAAKFLRTLYRQHGAANPRPIFRLLIIATDDAYASRGARLSDLMSVASVFPTVGNRAWFTTTALLQQEQHTSSPLAGTMWYKTSDLSVDIPASWQKQVAMKKFDRLPPKRLRDTVGSEISNMPRYRLFGSRGKK